MVLRPQSSWISRGLIFTILFIGFGAIQLAFSYWLPGTTGETVFKVLSGIMAFGVMAYTGFTLGYVKGIPFWNSAILPALLILWGILSGLAMVMNTDLVNSSVDTRVIEGVSIILLVSAIILIVLYLWTATYAAPAAKESVKELIRGYLGLVLGLGVGLVGVIIPLATLLVNYLAGMGTLTLSMAIVIIACEIIGGLSLTYSFLKVGLYSPLVST
jgi:formate-dependent nitrite reductase membrane component NrfD